MKPSIYFGNVTSYATEQPPWSERPYTEVTQSTITFTGFDLAYDTNLDPTEWNKLDLLFYNRVNEIGEILSSLVYISNVLEIDDITEKVYDVSKLYVNTDAELIMGVTEDMTDFTYFNCKWKSGSFFTSSISPLSGTVHDELAANGIPSVKLECNGIAFDGWYTQMSVAVRTINTGDGSPHAWIKNMIGFHNYADLGLELSILLTSTASDADTNWSPYTTILENGTVNPDGTILVAGNSLASVLISTSEDNPYVKQDIFILPTYIALYDTAVIQYAEYPTYGNPFPTLRDKHRIIHNFASNNEFLEAQYILQTTEFSRMTTQM